MKKLRVKMAEVAHVDGDEMGKKKKSFCSGMKKVFEKVLSPLKQVQLLVEQEEEEEKQKEITAADIEQLIEEKKYEAASKGLIVLEEKIFSEVEEPPLQEAELESLYEKLKAAVFQVIKDSIANTDVDLLRQAVQAIVEQEARDSNCGSDSGKGSKSRPRRWKKTWEEYIRSSVTDRLDNLPVDTLFKEYASTISQTLAELGKTFRDDLIHVVTHLKACYPKDFDVCNMYAQQYHNFIMAQMRATAQFELEEKDTFLLLSWVHDIYPNRILMHPVLAENVDESRLKSLLPGSAIRQLESNYLAFERESVRTHMNKALDMQVDAWKSGTEPRLLGRLYHSELHIDIIQRYDSGIKTAAKMRPEMAEKLAPHLDLELKDFLTRYKKLFGEFLERNKTQEHYRGICAANLNCCQSFREFITHKETNLKESSRNEMLSTLQELEDTIYDILLQDLFADIKSQFRRMSQSSSPFSHYIFRDLIGTARHFVTFYVTLCPHCFKRMNGKIHFFVVKEHLARILKKKFILKNVQQQQALANQINENAELINNFFTSNGSEESWLKSAIPKVAEIIRLQDLNAIQLEVATLIQAYPDIHNKQISTILKIKGNLSKQEVKSIIATAETIERFTSNAPKLFELIKKE